MFHRTGKVLGVVLLTLCCMVTGQSAVAQDCDCDPQTLDVSLIQDHTCFQIAQGPSWFEIEITECPGGGFVADLYMKTPRVISCTTTYWCTQEDKEAGNTPCTRQREFGIIDTDWLMTISLKNSYAVVKDYPNMLVFLSYVQARPDSPVVRAVKQLLGMVDDFVITDEPYDEDPLLASELLRFLLMC